MEEDLFKLFLTDYLNLRERQKAFFRTRDRAILMECKRLEADLDKRAKFRLGIADQPRHADDPRQGDLFDETR